MFPLSAAVLMCLVAPTLAQGSQTYCTLDNQFTVGMTHVQQAISGGTESSRFYYDFTNSRTSIQYFNYSTSPSTNLNRVVADYSTGIQYTIDNTGSCSQFNFGTSQPMLPTNFQNLTGASYLGTSFVGHPSNSLTYDSYRFPLGSLTITLLVSIPECVPILEGVIGTFGTYPVDTILYFSGYQGSITNQNVFDTSMC